MKLFAFICTFLRCLISFVLSLSPTPSLSPSSSLVTLKPNIKLKQLFISWTQCWQLSSPPHIVIILFVINFHMLVGWLAAAAATFALLWGRELWVENFIYAITFLSLSPLDIFVLLSFISYISVFMVWGIWLHSLWPRFFDGNKDSWRPAYILKSKFVRLVWIEESSLKYILT